MPRRSLVACGVALVALGVAATAFVTFFLGSSRTLVVGGHDTEVEPGRDQHLVIRTGPLLPDVRRPLDGPFGVELQLGKTEEAGAQRLLGRYAFIAAHPDAEVAKVEDAVHDMAVAAALRGVALGTVPVVVWLLLGSHRRGELLRGLPTRRGAVAAGLVLALSLIHI